MPKKKLTVALAATALVALVGGAPASHAQTMPAPRVMVPVQAPPDEVDYYSDAPKVEPGDFNWSARRNVKDSDRYETLVHTNPAFRAARIDKECGPITEPDLYQQCVATFNY